MRTISPLALSKITAPSGSEPVIIVQIFWNGIATMYSDRKFAQDGLIGRLLEVSGIEDVVDITANSSSTQLSVVLDDSDGSIKQLFDNVDIHKVPVNILQWFAGIPLSEAFPIFEGEIYSPIVWSEGARTLKFDVVTKITDIEVGFSVEEGAFPFEATTLVGKAWPVVFGKVAALNPLQLNQSPSGVFAEGFSILNELIWAKDLKEQQRAVADAKAQADEAWIQGLNNAYKAGSFKAFSPEGFADDPVQATQYDTAASNYFAQSANYRTEQNKLQNELASMQRLKSEQESFQKRVIRISGSNFPQGVPFTIQFGNWIATATVEGNYMSISEPQLKVDVNASIEINEYAYSQGLTTPATTQQVLANQNEPTGFPLSDHFIRVQQPVRFTWIDGGTEFSVFNYPIYYIVSVGIVSVINVWGQTKYGRQLVPPNWYVVDYPNLGGGLVITRILFPTPLTSYPGFWEAGNIEIDCQSAIGPNAVDIMQYVISKWGTFGIDPATFAYVRAKVAPYPMNFALTTRMNVVSFLKEVAFQARCAIYVKDRTYFIKYLAEIEPSVATLTDDDIEVNSVVVTTTETERLVTRFVAEWKDRVGQTDPNVIIFRYNVQRYGIVEERYNFFCYNQFECVEQAAIFWTIRKANTFKIMQCKVSLHKLAIEAFDYVDVTFNENLVANGTAQGMVTKAMFQPDDDSIALEIWFPIRFGEMVPYDFAYPDSTSQFYPQVTDPNINTRNPFAGANGEFAPIHIYPKYTGIKFSFLNPWTQGPGLPADDPPAPQDLIVALNTNPVDQSRPPGIEVPFNQYNDKTKYSIRQLQPVTLTSTTPNVFYGETISRNDDGSYLCNVWLKGLDNDPRELSVRVGQLNPTSTLPPGFPLTVGRTVWKDTDFQGNPTVNFQYFAQPPVWVPPPPPPP